MKRARVWPAALLLEFVEARFGALSSPKVADVCGAHGNSVRNWRNGTTWGVKQPDAARFAATLGVDPAEIWPQWAKRDLCDCWQDVSGSVCDCRPVRGVARRSAGHKCRCGRKFGLRIDLLRHRLESDHYDETEAA